MQVNPTISRPQAPIQAQAWDSRVDRAQEQLEKGNLEAAAAQLKGCEADPSGTAQGLLGTIQFRQERYQEAASQLEAAAAKSGDPEIQELARLARDNANANADHEFAANPFDKEVLLGAPRPGAPAPFAAEVRPAPKNWVEALSFKASDAAQASLRFAGHVAGAIIGAGIGVAARIWGQEDKDALWTTWSKQHTAKALMMLDHMRTDLNKHCLHDTYPEGTLTGFLAPGTPVPEGAKWARTADGTFNNLENPKEGAAMTRFGRNVDRAVTKPHDLLDPNPRELSRVLGTRSNDQMKEIPFGNMFMGLWIQFMVHDWVGHGDPDYTNLIEIPMAQDDPARKKFHQNSMFVPGTMPDPTRQASEAGDGPTFINEVTHWWDGSQIYGSDLKTQMSLRTGQDGKMAVDEKGNIPVGADGVEKTGFKRNWWLGLDLLHNLFVREHNSICDMLKEKHPEWSDQKLFDVARLINVAEMAKIHTEEWTPAVLPNETLDKAMKFNWFGAYTHYFQNDEARKTLEKFPIYQEVVGGIVGGDIDKHGSPYSLSEEFAAVYRLHSLLPDSFNLLHIGVPSKAEKVDLAETRLKGAHKIVDSHEMEDLMYSMGVQHSGQLVLNNYPKTLQNLSIPGFSFFDMMAVDILRDRERGVPRYNEFRRQLGLKPLSDFSQISDDKQQVEALRKLYKNDIEKVDLLVGTLAEGHRPEHFGFGETLFQVFILNASRRLQADRFFTTNYNAQTYTQEGLDRIDQTKFKSLLLRHFPHLGETGLKNVKNGFEPWDEDPKQVADPGRHPLAQFRN